MGSWAPEISRARRPKRCPLLAEFLTKAIEATGFVTNVAKTAEVSGPYIRELLNEVPKKRRQYNKLFRLSEAIGLRGTYLREILDGALNPEDPAHADDLAIAKQSAVLRELALTESCP